MSIGYKNTFSPKLPGHFGIMQCITQKAGAVGTKSTLLHRVNGYPGFAIGIMIIYTENAIKIFSI